MNNTFFNNNNKFNNHNEQVHYRNPIVRKKSYDINSNINKKPNEYNINKIKYSEKSINEDKPYINYNYNDYNNNNNNNNQNFNKRNTFTINKNASSTNVYNKDYQKKPFIKNDNKLNNLYKRKRNSSAKNNEEHKGEKYFYKLICNNCYNNKIVTENIKKKPLEEKDILNKTFNKMNPYYFQDKMNDIHKDKKDNKIKELEKLQKQVMDNLLKYQKANPSNVEKLQKTNEFSVNPLNSYEKEDPRLIKTLNNYDKKENFINNNKDLYKIDKPRKAINDYYNKCLYQVPILEEEYHIDPEGGQA